MSNHLFLTFAGGTPDRRRQYVNYCGKDTKTNRIDLQIHMGELGLPSRIIEVDGSFTKDQAYDFAKQYAHRFNLPVVTDRENLARMKTVNREVDHHSKLIRASIKKLSIPADLKEDLLVSCQDVVENWRGWKQEEL